MYSKAQISVEFFIFVGLAFMMALAFEIASLDQMKDFRVQRESELVKDLTLKLQKETLIAASVEDGYVRAFEAPNNLEGINYSLTTKNMILTVESENSIYTVTLPDSIGNLTKGVNIIKKTGGVVHIN